MTSTPEFKPSQVHKKYMRQCGDQDTAAGVAAKVKFGEISLLLIVTPSASIKL